MTQGDGIPWNAIPDSAADVDTYQALLRRTQPDDQIKEGRQWDERARKRIISAPSKPS
jgi:hypothetical protein